MDPASASTAFLSANITTRVIWDSAECGAAFADESSAVLDASVPAEVLLFDLA
jgi:hypothetical protein